MMNASRLLRPGRRAMVSAVAALTAAAGLLTLEASASQAVASGTRTVAAKPASTTVAKRTTSSTLQARAAAATPSMALNTYESRVRYWINVERTKRGLGRLTYASCADGYAKRWSTYLADTGRFEHQSMWTILKGCRAQYAGETLGRGSITPRYLVRLWMNSPTHRHVLLSKSPRRVGIGAVPDANGQWVVAADFLRG